MEIRISLHAAKQAKARLVPMWQHAKPTLPHGERFESWFRCFAFDAVSRGRITGPDRRHYRRVTFVYDFAVNPVTLITVIVPNWQRPHRYGDGGSRRIILSERAERMLERGAVLARGEDLE